MLMKEVQVKAIEIGVKPGKLKKAELVHAIQAAEGNDQYFGKSNGECPYFDCCFREDCLKIVLK